jgi:hypothetical protein
MAVYLPFQIAHFSYADFDKSGSIFANVMMFLFFWFDNIFYLRTSYLDHENEIIDGKMILKTQSWSWTFFFMMVTSIPWFFMVRAAEGDNITLREKNLLYIHMARLLIPRTLHHSFVTNIKLGLLWRMCQTFSRVFLAVPILMFLNF